MKLNNPIGIMIAHVGNSAPTGYLICDGASYLRSDYPDLFAIIGTAFGSADGSHFNVPDCRGRQLRGYNSGDANFNAVGKAGGSKTADMSHTHTMNAHTHTASGTSGNNSGGAAENGTDSVNIAQSPHAHAVNVTTGVQTDTGSNTMLGNVSVMNPYSVLNWIIKSV